MKQYGFPVCCGASIWALTEPYDSVLGPPIQELEKWLKDTADNEQGSYSVAITILNTEQKNLYEKTILSFGFKKMWSRGIRNVNTGNGLYGYYLNLNTYKKPKTKRKPMFARSK